MTHSAEDRVCVVGAGPAGLSLGRTLKALGIPFDVYERHAGVGGIWDQGNPGSPIYDSVHFISSKTQSHFLDFEMPTGYPDYPSHRQILAYLRAFADSYGLAPCIRFNTVVDQAEPVPAGWRVRLSTGASREYRWLVVASGMNWSPRLPSYPGEFSGEVRHAVSYRSPDEFRGKRVLVVGGGNSGCDIACDAAETADAAFISLRRGYHIMPKYIFGQPLDVFANENRLVPTWLSQIILAWLLRLINGDVTRFGLKSPDHKVLESHPIVNSRILPYLSQGKLVAKPDVARFEGGEMVFSDGTREHIDLVLFATGYRWQLPYLGGSLLAWRGGRLDLYINIFSRQHERLFVLGLLETDAGIYRLLDDMADLIARAILAQRDRPDEARRLADIVRDDRPDLTGGVRYINSERHADYVEINAYRKQIKRVRRRMGWPEIARGHYQHTRTEGLARSQSTRASEDSTV
jgi:hypothetical protein